MTYKNTNESLDEVDIIGDIHGHATALEKLLESLGYNKRGGTYFHRTRIVLFLGDFIDRGPRQREVIDIVRPMVESGHAMAIMGNHELNAIAYHTTSPTKPGEYIRPNNKKNHGQHKAFLDSYPDTKERLEVIEWFKTLPLWLDLGDFRAVHACWHQESIDYIHSITGSNTLSDKHLESALTPGNKLFDCIEVILKGIEIKLPEGNSFCDSDGNRRDSARIMWWLNESTSYADAIFDKGVAEHLVDTIPKDKLPGYSDNEKPCFIGHYWFKGVPSLIYQNLACLDYSIAKHGKLVAYKWKGKKKLSENNFFWVQPSA